MTFWWILVVVVVVVVVEYLYSASRSASNAVLMEILTISNEYVLWAWIRVSTNLTEQISRRFQEGF